MIAVQGRIRNGFGLKFNCRKEDVTASIRGIVNYKDGAMRNLQEAEVLTCVVSVASPVPTGIKHVRCASPS